MEQTTTPFSRRRVDWIFVGFFLTLFGLGVLTASAARKSAMPAKLVNRPPKNMISVTRNTHMPTT